MSGTAQDVVCRTLTAVEVKMIPSDELTLPPEFHVSLYENLIEQLRKKGVFQRVYRDGDQAPTTLQI